MIPKIIHYCWLSDDPFPPKIQKCVDSWHKYLKGYELRLWRLDSVPENEYPWVREAFEKRKYAFAADCIRAYALYKYGGIYMDSDVEVLGNFDKFLHLPYFIGYENGSGFLEPAIMGAEAGNEIFGKLLRYYHGRHFVKTDGALDMLPMPQIVDIVLKPHYQIVDIPSAEHFGESEECIYVLPHDFFSPVHRVHGELQQTDRTVAIHHFASSWVPWHKKLKKTVKQIVGTKATKWFISTKRRFISKRP